jgi:hypothetical protein
MEDDRISKPEDQLIRNWIKRTTGVKISQYDLWNLTPGDAVKRLFKDYQVVVTVEDIEKAARRNK